MADVASSTQVSTLVATLWSDVRALADEREVDLDLRLFGKPTDIAGATQDVVAEVVKLVVESARSAAELHHGALEVAFGAESVSVRIEHDGTLGSGQRSRAENLILTKYGEVSALGGTLSLSSGRGYGMRIEITMPYVPTDGLEGVAAAAPGRIPPERVQVTAGSSLASVEPLTAQEAITLNLLAAGLSNKEIAGRMHLGVGTVKFHLAQIYQKLGVQGRGRVAAVARARELGLIFD
ncbi:MAG: LuxR C-terminal-related transcriptional regulator [Chloroflexota bacterium]